MRTSCQESGVAFYPKNQGCVAMLAGKQVDIGEAKSPLPPVENHLPDQEALEDAPLDVHIVPGVPGGRSDPVLGKSCKPIPVMLLGVTLLRKKYPPAKYLCVLLIVAGVALFLYKPKKGAGSEDHVFGYGELLLLLSLTLDGLTGVSQDHMRAHYQTGSNHMMLNVNLWSTLFLGAGILFTGELWEFLRFTERHPGVISNILLFGLTSALGQSFIFMTVVYFGPLTCSIITTTRKFFTILASVILFANPISPMQWVGTVLVFLGLGLDAKFGKGVKKTSH
ncbi:solute carrier family 35, member B1 [Columba livia]|uniref:Solute carrier family 35 member B1 n=1 Tax=Columba livia TaxID=8932 RepID=A0A2I0LSG7_COLLI|nr:solute carrier family 35, member B1 [Columba livia]